MGRLIDADKAIENLMYGNSDSILLRQYATEAIKTAPAVNAVPVVRGKWKPVKYTAHCSCGRSYETYHYSCSACNHISYAQPYGLNYCPNCGAKMDKEKEDEE